MKPKRNQPLFASAAAFVLLLAATLTPAGAAVIVDFDPTGEFAAQFTGGAYTENATGGLNGSIGINLANTSVTSFTGNQSESLAANGFSQGNSFTVGAFFNLSALPTSTGTAGQVLRLGITNGGTGNFTSLPFSTIEVTNTTTGAAQFRTRQSLTAGGSFTLATNEWYYFETTFTRGAGQEVTYDMLIASATSAGAIGSIIDTFSFGSASELAATQLNDAIFGAFKGNSNAVGVLDNFYVSNTGVSLIPEPTSALAGILLTVGLLRRRR